VNVVLYSILQA